MFKKILAMPEKKIVRLLLFFCMVFVSSCGGNTDESSVSLVGKNSGLCLSGNDLAGVNTDYANALLKYTSTNSTNTIKVCVDGSEIVVISSNVPEHESSYFNIGHTLYEAFDYFTNQYRFPDLYAARSSGSNDGSLLHSAGSNKIQQHTITMRIPLYPQEATIKTSTTYSTIGLALNGVSFFNENAAPSDDIRDELFTFDQCSGHPQQQGVYHYHVEPVCLIRDLGGSVSDESYSSYHWIEDDGTNANLLLGFLMDGFPVYGPIGSGGETDYDDNTVNVSIDAYNGHSHTTRDFSTAIYHYHVKTANAGGAGSPVFWITNEKYFGEVGSVTIE